MVLILSGTLTKHLADINEAAHDRTVLIVKQMAKQQGITEQLKSSNWLTWLQAMNNIQASARELVFSEIVYVFTLLLFLNSKDHPSYIIGNNIYTIST